MEVLKERKKLLLSPAVVTILAASFTASLPLSARGENINSHSAVKTVIDEPNIPVPDKQSKQTTSSKGKGSRTSSKLKQTNLKQESTCTLSPRVGACISPETIVAAQEIFNTTQAEFPDNESPQLEIPQGGDRPSEFPIPTPGSETQPPVTPEQPPVPETEPPTTDEQLPETPEQAPEPETEPPAAPPQPTEQAPTPAPEPRVLVAEVEVVGVDEELQDVVYATIGTTPGRTTTRSQLQEDVNAVYATGFFQDVRVTPEDTPLGVRITFAVVPNPVLDKVVVETIPPEAERVLPPEVVQNIFSDEYGQILNLRDLQEGIKQLNQWYTKNGYELAQVVAAPQVSPDGTVTLIVAEGVIEDIQVRFFDEEDEPTGGRTRDFIVTREMQLEPGDVFNRNTAQRDLQRVFGLGIFEDVRLSFSPGTDPSEVVMNVDVVESSTGSISAGAGISSASGLFGTVSYQQQNLGGNNQTLGAEFQLGQREVLFDLSFTDPWIGGDPFRTGYTIDAFRRRSISLVFDGDDNDIRTADGDDSPRVVRTGGGINFTRPIAPTPFNRADWNLSAGFQYQHVTIKNADGDIAPISRPEDGSQNLAFSDDGEDDLFLFRFGATRDRRNSVLQPTRGSVLRLNLDQSAPLGSGSILLSRVRGSYSYYIPVGLLTFTEGPQALAFNIQAGTVLGDLPPYEAFVLGGSNSVRGYPEGELGNGRSYLQGTAEYRFPIFSVIGGALFVDFGTTLGSQGAVPGEPGEVRDLPGVGFGYGLGVRVQSPLGPIRVDYGINDEGDSRIHFGIGERF
ncbi:BamA/TamA family outer membrane protein [Pleurocapsales cyanobacterium LEGE 06147]|nr:BamA/TamA family outer membrane protein [Pleurocapsales cyanobacterium LEGE 06147]